MSAKDILMRAVQCDQAGRILEAQYNYQNGIQLLMELVDDETDVAKKKVYYERIKEYIDRAEQIKLKVQRHVSQGELVDHIPIDENSTGHSYKSLFGKYVNSDVQEVLLEEPYLVERYQRENFISFLELLLKKSKQLTYILLITNRLPQNSLDIIKNDLNSMKVNLEIKYEERLHDRKIVLMNGYVIKIGRGLHIFKNSFFSIGYHDFDFRKCLQTEVDILRIKKFQ